MSAVDPLPIAPVAGPLDASVRVPGSKSVTNRALVCAALAEGTSVLEGALFADDTEAMAGVLAGLGIEVRADPAAARLEVVGCGGAVPPSDAVLDVRQSGTTSRFTAALLAAGEGTYRVDAHPQMRARPMDATFEALAQLGATVAADAPGHLPARITAPAGAVGHRVTVPGDASSQFLSGLLLVGPCLPGGLRLEVTTPLVSQPYVALTLDVMAAFGAEVERPDDATFVVAPTGYRARTHAIEPDASAASYPLAAAAICGGRVTVEGLGADARQGDAGFADLLAAMGATVERTASSTTVTAERGTLVGGRFDLTHLSDTAQTLAVVAPFASTPVAIEGIGFIRRKEIDRLTAVATELARCGVDVRLDDDGWTISPSSPRGALVETYEDHRMAMSFALLGLVVDGISIAGPDCVAKTFPGYWDLLAGLRPGGGGR
ncbi:MAG: 3-phosphoshikimate 1-carboxyvinyltransferase [Acidimicrobiales bacterium]|nr:3-phosphoshikimate 1-carboxyvinyltransferase [Acidimicrobiales bacterium]